jgi:hypothetical protein
MKNLIENVKVDNPVFNKLRILMHMSAKNAIENFV